jgi:acyl-coenzyme A synthetase/AMP-(fatty) acid ligase/acyl carrier protein
MNSRLPFEEHEVDGSIVARWRRVVECFPQAVAVTTVEGRRITYAELDLASNGLASALLDRLGAANSPVLLLLDHSYELIVGIYGAMKAKKAYVVLDPTQAIGQSRLLCENAAASLIVTRDDHVPLAQSIAAGGESIWSMDVLPAAGSRPENPPISADSIAAILFTSGTISRPKGVVCPHRMILHRAWFEAGTSGFGPGHRIAGIRPCGLSPGASDLFNALLTGATYCLYALRSDGLQGFSRWLQDEEITYFHPPIIFFRQWLLSLSPHDYFPLLSQVLPSGRKSGADIARLWPHVARECVVLTSYASTETSLITLRVLDNCTCVPEGTLDVGRPIPGKSVSVVDAAGQPGNAGEIGEVVVRSRYLSPGYWRAAELSAQRFQVSDDGSGEICYFTGDFGYLRADGCLELVGRRDSQVKVRGYRVVLSEVEDALRALPAVREAVVTFDEDRDRLLAYLLAADDPPALASAIRSVLAMRFPDYALPSRLIYLDSLPLLPSGKIDRRALPRPDRSRPDLAVAFLRPRTTLENEIAAVWAEVLGIDAVGVDDDFFALGGHSLLTTRLLMEVEKRYGVEVPLGSFFRAPTIAHLAEILERATATARPQSEASDDASMIPNASPGRPPEAATMMSVFDVLEEPPELMRMGRRPLWKSRWVTRLVHPCLANAPPGLSTALLSGLTANARLRSLLFNGKQKIIRKFFESIDASVDIESAIASSLFFHFMHRLQTRRPDGRRRGTGGHDLQETQVIGRNKLEGARERGQGVVLVRSHFYSEATFASLELADHRIGSVGHVLRRLRRRSRLDENALYVHQLDSARKKLLKGTSPYIELTFHRRRRRFMTGFAELAVMTDAAVLVVDSSMQRSLDSRVELIGPLDSGRRTLGHEDRVEMLVSQYAKILQQMWIAEPWKVEIYQMEMHLASPLAARKPR